MTSEQGTIIKTNGNNAWVRVKRSTMCECCKSRSSCETLGGGGDMEAEALNTAGGKVGDRVLLRISSKSLLKISFIFYMTPVLALIIGAVIGNKIGEKLSLNPELCSLLLGIVTCAISFVFIKMFSKHHRNNREYMPEIIKILSSDPGRDESQMNIKTGENG